MNSFEKQNPDYYLEENKTWANQIPENTLDNPFYETKVRIEKMTATKNSDEWKEKVPEIYSKRNQTMTENNEFEKMTRRREEKLLKEKGITNVFQDEKVIEKWKQTNLERYGYENHSTYLANRPKVLKIKNMIDKPAKLFGRSWWRQSEDKLADFIKSL